MSQTDISIEKKRAQVAELLRMRIAAPKRFPLSYQQQALWFADQVKPDDATYNIPGALRLQGQLDVSALQKSLNQIVNRHDVLRARFEVIDHGPAQVVSEAVNLAIDLVDLQEIPEAMRYTRALDLAAKEASIPFDLRRAPLLRAKLMRLAPQEHILLIVMHHIVTDAWSTAIFVRELAHCYAAYSNGCSPSLPELEIQYSDFVLWQKRWLGGERLEQSLEYWRRQLADVEVLHLPTKSRRPAIASHNGATIPFEVPAPEADAVRVLARKEGATPFMILLAAFQLLLARYSGSKGFAVGTPVAGRSSREIEGLIGYFVNTLVLRTELDGNPSVREFLKRVRSTCLEAYAHQDVPFESLVRELQPARDQSRSPLFQAMLVLQNVPEQRLEFPNLTIRDLEVKYTPSKFDLELQLFESACQITGHLYYAANLFTAEAMEGFHRHFQHLLRDMCQRPDCLIQDLHLATSDDVRRLMSWNSTSSPYTSEATIPSLFESQVRKTPHAPALVCGDRMLTFGSLNEQANRLAAYLKGIGLAKGDLVAVFLDRSLETVVVLLAILKAGGAYVPLDTRYPEQRLRLILQDSKPRFLISQADLLAQIPLSASSSICLDREHDEIEKCNSSDIDAVLGSDSVAYVIYTSGSTGKPKGVLATHRGAINRFTWMWQKFPFKTGEVCCQKTSLSFVDSIWEVFGPLLMGVQVVVVPVDTVTDIPRFVELLERHRVSRIVLVPSLLRVLLDQTMDLAARLVSLKLWIVSGEQLPRELAAQFGQIMPKAILLNLYGSSEIAADSTFEIVEDINSDGAIPIGRPIANTSVFILDDNWQLLPPGVRGELSIGGDGLALGYLNEPRRTAEHFIPDACSGRVGARLYRSGDKGEWSIDGILHYHGRIDRQVKIRGFRVELGEIESVISTHPDIDQVAVIDRESAQREKHLAAYVTVRPSAPFSVPRLRTFLRDRLPEYMIPAAVVPLPALPLNANGKIDRLALRQRKEENLRGDARTPPRNPLELQLLRIWNEALQDNSFGVKDSFFDVGGHSLSAVRVIGQIERRFERHLTLAHLFKHRTIEQLAALLTSEGVDSSSDLISLKAAGSKNPLFLIHPVSGHALPYLEFADALDADRPIYAIQSPALNAGTPAPQTIEEMAAQYLALVLSTQPRGPYLLGGWSFGGVVAFEMAQQLSAAGRTIESLILLDSIAPLPEFKTGKPSLSELLADFTHDLALLLGRPVPITQDQIALHEPEKQLDFVLSQPYLLDLLPPGLGAEHVRHLFRDVYLPHISALLSYTPQPFHDADVFLLRAGDGLDPEEKALLDPTRNGWKSLVGASLRVETLPGDHYTFLRKPHVRDLTSRMVAMIDRERTSAQ